jgi:hypothetical protein
MRITADNSSCPYCGYRADQSGNKVERLTDDCLTVDCACGQTYMVLEVADE